MVTDVLKSYMLESMASRLSKEKWTSIRGDCEASAASTRISPRLRSSQCDSSGVSGKILRTSESQDKMLKLSCVLCLVPAFNGLYVHTSETLLLVWSAWLRLFGALCSQVYHAPRSILLSLWVCSWNQHHQSRSSGVEETDWSELTSYGEQDGEMSNADRWRYPCGTLMSVPCCR